MRVLLLGSGGYIGSALVPQLVEDSTGVEAVDLAWFDTRARAKRQSRDFGSITPDEVAEFRTVMLLAGHSSVAMCERNREAAFHNNVANFVELLGKLHNQRFLYASSASVYGNTHGEDGREDEKRFEPRTYYDLCKCEIDHYAQLSNLDYYGLRFGTVNGFAPHLRTDVMLNRMVESFLATGSIRVSNPEVNRPILGIRDLCRAVRAILERAEPAPGLYNLASFNATVGEIAERAAAILGAKIELAPPTPAYDMRVSTEKFERTFNFKFEETVESIVEDLVTNWDRAVKTTRSERKAYVRPR
jgi:nucleoside-diphosphate-sugar epimerase